MFRAIVKRHAMTGSRLGSYASSASPRVSAGTGGARAGKFSGGTLAGNVNRPMKFQEKKRIGILIDLQQEIVMNFKIARKEDKDKT
ncbi:MAG: hypothetical protein Q8N94_06825 [Methanoregula sp.]|nr:hypothetical protein [Methanoregula sp.]